MRVVLGVLGVLERMSRPTLLTPTPVDHGPWIAELAKSLGQLGHLGRCPEGRGPRSAVPGSRSAVIVHDELDSGRSCKMLTQRLWMEEED